MKRTLTVSLALSVLLAGCASEEHSDIKQWMKEQSQGMKSGVKDPPPLFTPPIVSYSASNVESPFSPEKVRSKEQLSASDKNNPALAHPPEYLEGFPLESLQLVGTINMNGKMFAIIRTTEKPKYVTVGNYIGQNFGQITAISKTEIKVSEPVKDNNDLWVKREKILYLQQDEGGKK